MGEEDWKSTHKKNEIVENGIINYRGVRPMKLSIVVPVYNTKEYLVQCIESILNQTCGCFELILIDDGSTDGSEQICDEYAKKDQRIRVIHQVNQGLVATRKRGVELATCDYVCFVDSDDWIDERLVEELVRNIAEEKPDIVAYGFFTYTDKSCLERVNLIPDGLYSGEELKKIFSTMMYDKKEHRSGIIQSIWTKVFKRDLLRQVYQDMDLRLTYGEDAAVVYSALLQAKLVKICNNPFYYYRIHDNSMCTKKDVGRFQEVVYFYEYMRQVFEMYPSGFQLLSQLKNYIVHFLEMLVRNNFEIKWYAPYKIPMKCTKMVLYGAGNIGKRYYEEIKERNDIHLVSWVDKNLVGQEIDGQRIQLPEEIVNQEYDCIVIAVLKKDIADSIRKELGLLGIEDEKIIWQYPERNAMLRKVIF